MFDPYKTLDLDRGASQAQIRSAFRKAAKQHHPDAGGDRQKFEEAMKANMILSDPQRRRKYDETGEIDEASVEQSIPNAMQHIIGFFINACEQARDDDVPRDLDLVKLALEFFHKQIAEFEKNKSVGQRKVRLLRKVMKRFKVKDGEIENNILGVAFANHIRQHEQTIAGLDRHIQERKDALTLLKDYSFVVEKSPPVRPQGTTYADLLAQTNQSFFKPGGWR